MSQKLITLKDAAKFLNVNSKVMEEMLEIGLFKPVKQGRTIKVDKLEIEEWLAKLTESEEEQLALRRTVCRFQDYFLLDNIILNFHADNKYEAIGEMSKFAKDLKLVRDHRWLYNVVVAREELVSTAVGNHVAFLHPRNMHPTKIKTPSILLGRCLDDEIDFDAPDNKPVKLFFMLLLHNDKQHLFSLSYLTRVISKPGAIEQLLAAQTKEEIYQIIANYSL